MVGWSYGRWATLRTGSAGCFPAPYCCLLVDGCTASLLTLVHPARLPPRAAEWALECLKVLLETNMQQNLQIVVNVAKEYTEQVRSGASC